MHKDYLVPGEKSRCFASTSLPLSMPPTLACYPSKEASKPIESDLQLPSVSETFEVTIQRNSLGLGLSIMGGQDAAPPFKHLIRVKKLFPLQPAWQTGAIQPGDILLKANDTNLTGLSLRQALDVLRCSPPVTTLLICRPIPDFYPDASSESLGQEDDEMSSSKFSSKVLRSYSYTPATRQLSLSMSHGDSKNMMTSSDAKSDVVTETNRIMVSTPEPQMNVDDDDDVIINNYHQDLDLLSPISLQNNKFNSNLNHYGEFTITLRKVNGSLGFSLYSQTDDSTLLRHSVKALVKEPALSDGRIRAGDKLVAANGVECGHLSHQELIQFLRKCPEEVTLRFYRDASRSQTPVSTPQHPSLPNFPTDNNKKSSFFTEKTQKFANFFNHGTASSSSSHPDLAFTSKPKQLRAEAKEMVRSLQASRSSLENGVAGTGSDSLSKNGSNASGGGSRRRIRPFSPARDPRVQHPHELQPNPICNSASAPLPFAQHLFENLSTSPVQSPTIESPMTPAGSHPDFARTNVEYYEDLSLGVRRLQIEELPSDENLAGKMSFSSYSSSSTHSDYLQSSFGAKFERPTELDLFGSGGNRKQQGFIFNK